MTTTATAPKNSTIVRSRTSIRLTKAVLQTAYAVSDELGGAFAERLFTRPRRHERPAREAAVLAHGDRFSVDVRLRAPAWRGKRVPIAAWRWGEGPTVMLVHGWEGRGSQLGAVVEPLVGAGMSVVAFDAPGHGDSPGDQLYLADLADCVSEVAARVGPHAIFAHSFGCAAVLLAHRRGGVDAARNVFVSPNAVVADAVRSFARAISLDDADRVAFQARVEARGGVPFAALGLDWLAGGRDAGLLVIHDRSDREVPLSHAERLVAAWPGAQLVTTDGLGHRKILRDPAVLAAATTFCAQGAPAPGSELPRLLGPELERIAAS